MGIKRSGGRIAGRLCMILAGVIILLSVYAYAEDISDNDGDGYDDSTGLDSEGFNEDGWNPGENLLKPGGRIPEGYTGKFGLVSGGSFDIKGRHLKISDPTELSMDADGNMRFDEITGDVSVDVAGVDVTLSNAKEIVVSPNAISGTAGDSCNFMGNGIRQGVNFIWNGGAKQMYIDAEPSDAAAVAFSTVFSGDVLFSQETKIILPGVSSDITVLGDIMYKDGNMYLKKPEPTELDLIGLYSLLTNRETWAVVNGVSLINKNKDKDILIAFPQEGLDWKNIKPKPDSVSIYADGTVLARGNMLEIRHPDIKVDGEMERIYLTADDGIDSGIVVLRNLNKKYAASSHTGSQEITELQTRINKYIDEINYEKEEIQYPLLEKLDVNGVYGDDTATMIETIRQYLVSHDVQDDMFPADIEFLGGGIELQNARILHRNNKIYEKSDNHIVDNKDEASIIIEGNDLWIEKSDDFIEYDDGSVLSWGKTSLVLSGASDYGKSIGSLTNEGYVSSKLRGLEGGYCARAVKTLLESALAEEGYDNSEVSRILSLNGASTGDAWDMNDQMRKIAQNDGRILYDARDPSRDQLDNDVLKGKVCVAFFSYPKPYVSKKSGVQQSYTHPLTGEKMYVRHISLAVVDPKSGDVVFPQQFGNNRGVFPLSRMEKNGYRLESVIYVDPSKDDLRI